METFLANKGGTLAIRAVFRDESGRLVTPSEIWWSLNDGDGEVVNDRDKIPVIPTAQQIWIILNEDDLTGGEVTPVRYLTVRAVYDSDIGNGMTATEEARISIRNLVGIKEGI